MNLSAGKTAQQGTNTAGKAVNKTTGTAGNAANKTADTAGSGVNKTVSNATGTLPGVNMNGRPDEIAEWLPDWLTNRWKAAAEARPS